MEEAAKIVGDYGDALIKTNKLGVIVRPESLLPYSKADIKLAIKTYWAFMKSLNKLSDEMKNQLEVGFMLLAHFASDKKVKAAEQNDTLLAKLYEEMDRESKLLLNEIRSLDKAFDLVTI